MALEASLGIDFSARKTNFEHNLSHGDDQSNEARCQLPLRLHSEKVKLSELHDENTNRKINIHLDKGTTTLAFIYKGGVVVCADSRATGGMYIGSQNVRKILPINSHLVGTMAGGAADCQYWLRLLSERCKMYELKNRHPISVAAASKILSNMIYQYKGMGLSMGTFICGWDHKKGPKIYMVGDEGTRILGNLFSVGSGSVYAYSILDKGYHYDMTDEEALDLGRKSIFHAAHRDSASGGVVRVYHIDQDGWKKISEDDFSILYDRYIADGTISLNH